MLVGLAAGDGVACSTILLARGPVLLLGHNLDEQTAFPGFSILKNLSGTLTRRSYVVDLRNRIIYFRTDAAPEIRHFRLEALDFGVAKVLIQAGATTRYLSLRTPSDRGTRRQPPRRHRRSVPPEPHVGSGAR